MTWTDRQAYLGALGRLKAETTREMDRAQVGEQSSLEFHRALLDVMRARWAYGRTR